MKRDLAFEFERELRAVRNLILGATRLSGTEYTIELTGNEGFVAGSRARAAFIEAFHAATHEALVKYAHDLAHECLEHGMDQEIVGGALGGYPFQGMRHMPAQQPMPAQMREPMPPQQTQPQHPQHPESQAEGSNTVRLAACA
jgi:hypothetical protein